MTIAKDHSFKSRVRASFVFLFMVVASVCLASCEDVPVVSQDDLDGSLDGDQQLIEPISFALMAEGVTGGVHLSWDTELFPSEIQFRVYRSEMTFEVSAPVDRSPSMNAMIMMAVGSKTPTYYAKTRGDDFFDWSAEPEETIWYQVRATDEKYEVVGLSEVTSAAPLSQFSPNPDNNNTTYSGELAEMVAVQYLGREPEGEGYRLTVQLTSYIADPTYISGSAVFKSADPDVYYSRSGWNSDYLSYGESMVFSVFWNQPVCDENPRYLNITFTASADLDDPLSNEWDLGLATIPGIVGNISQLAAFPAWLTFPVISDWEYVKFISPMATVKVSETSVYDSYWDEWYTQSEEFYPSRLADGSVVWDTDDPYQFLSNNYYWFFDSITTVVQQAPVFVEYRNANGQSCDSAILSAVAWNGPAIAAVDNSDLLGDGNAMLKVTGDAAGWQGTFDLSAGGETVSIPVESVATAITVDIDYARQDSYGYVTAPLAHGPLSVSLVDTQTIEFVGNPLELPAGGGPVDTLPDVNTSCDDTGQVQTGKWRLTLSDDIGNIWFGPEVTEFSKPSTADAWEPDTSPVDGVFMDSSQGTVERLLWESNDVDWITVTDVTGVQLVRVESTGNYQIKIQVAPEENLIWDPSYDWDYMTDQYIGGYSLIDSDSHTISSGSYQYVVLDGEISTNWIVKVYSGSYYSYYGQSSCKNRRYSVSMYSMP